MPERFLGRTLGKYRIESILGSGGFAWVYKAYDPELEIPVALKILKPQYAGDEKLESRFRREASTAARLRHPNIVKIYNVGTEDGAVYFAMDFLPQNLHGRLEVMKTLPEQMLIRVGIDVASALGYAHREGVIHRDIKIDNILFDEHGNAIVADFGIARAVSGYVQETGTNMVVGTPQYFAPEQARALPLDGRADIYSLGVTMFRASTGTLPFNGDDWYEIARQHVEEKPPRPRSINPTISKDLEDIILKCLEKDPADRYPTGEALCQELASLVGPGTESGSLRIFNVPAAITAESAASPLPRIRRRKRAMRRMAVGGGALALLVAIGLLAARRQTPKPRPSGAPAVTAASDSVRNAATLAPRVDSAAASRAATAPRPEPRRLSISGSAGTKVSVDGAVVKTLSRGDTKWQSDTSIAAGKHVITASIAGGEQCPASMRSYTREVTLSANGTKSVRIPPLGCGRLLAFTTDPEGAQYTVRNSDGDLVNQGTTPLKSDLVLPAGPVVIEIRRDGYQLSGPYHLVVPRDSAVKIPGRTRIGLVKKP